MSDDHLSKVDDPILEYPEFAATLGMVISQAAHLETQLAALFSHIVGSDAERGKLLYWSFPTFYQRRRTMDFILDHTSLPFEAQARSIIRRAKKYLTFRNDCAHNLWRRIDPGSSPMERITVNTLRDEPGSVTVKLKEMREKVRAAVTLNADLKTLIDELDGRT